MITEKRAIELARAATEGKAELQPGCAITVDSRPGVYIVTFIHDNAPGVRGPEYDARVTLDAETGDVIQILGAS